MHKSITICNKCYKKHSLDDVSHDTLWQLRDDADVTKLYRSNDFHRAMVESSVSWSSKKQDCTAMSTAEAEYVSLSACVLKSYGCVLKARLRFEYIGILLYCDSKSAIAISCNPVQHSKTKHIDISIAASASVPWIYMAQFWHTLKEDGSKNRLKFLLDRKELTLTLDDFRTIFHFPQANDNKQASFVPARISSLIWFIVQTMLDLPLDT
ncbi:hypothetical protein Tco_0120813 [Tanacetum coccineum]